MEGFYARAGLVLRFMVMQLGRLAFPWLVGLAIGSVVLYLSSIRNMGLRSRLNSRLGVVGGALLGIVNPMPTISTAASVISLLAAGLPHPVLMAFLISSPLLDPTMLILTILILGPGLAVARVMATVLIGCLGSLVVRVAGLRSVSVDLVRKENESVSESAPTQLDSLKRSEFFVGWARLFLKQFWYGGRHFLLAIALTAWIAIYVPRSWITALFGVGSQVSVLSGSLLGIPAYSCGGGAISLIDGLIEQGMSRGSALAFLIFGPATTVRTLSAMATVLNWRGMILFIVLTFGVSVAFGYGWELLIP